MGRGPALHVRQPDPPDARRAAPEARLLRSCETGVAICVDPPAQLAPAGPDRAWSEAPERSQLALARGLTMTQSRGVLLHFPREQRLGVQLER